MSYRLFMRQLARLRGVGLTLIFAMFGWAVALPVFFTTTSAATLNLVSATASSSAPSVSTSYIVRFTTINPIGSTASGFSSTTRITFDPLSNGFSLTQIATATDIFISSSAGVTLVAGVGSCTVPTTNEVYVSQVGHNQPADFIEFRTCDTDTVAAGAITVNIANAHVTNPSALGSYVVRINGTMTDAGDTRIAIVDRVTVTAVVDTNLTFTINGVASSTVIGGGTTSTTTSATAIGFGTLSIGTSSMAGQRLTVATNALNGFSVTVTQNQNLLSNNGADIDAFQDGNAVTGAPIAWTTPTGTLGNENSYGHFGLTSADTSISGGNPFAGGTLYAGLTSTSTRTVMYHDQPADGTTPNIGETYVLYRVQITALQEAATDYTNQLTYVCTPIF